MGKIENPDQDLPRLRPLIEARYPQFSGREIILEPGFAEGTSSLTAKMHVEGMGSYVVTLFPYTHGEIELRNQQLAGALYWYNYLNRTLIHTFGVETGVRPPYGSPLATGINLGQLHAYEEEDNRDYHGVPFAIATLLPGEGGDLSTITVHDCSRIGQSLGLIRESSRDVTEFVDLKIVNPNFIHQWGERLGILEFLKHENRDRGMIRHLLEKEETQPNLVEFIRRVKDDDDPILTEIEAERARLQQAWDALDPRTLETGIVNGDYFWDNLMTAEIGGERYVVGIADPYEACTHFRDSEGGEHPMYSVYDLGVAIVGAGFEADGSLNLDKVKALIGSYYEVIQPTQEELEAIPLMMQMATMFLIDLRIKAAQAEPKEGATIINRDPLQMWERLQEIQRVVTDYSVILPDRLLDTQLMSDEQQQLQAIAGEHERFRSHSRLYSRMTEVMDVEASLLDDLHEALFRVLQAVRAEVTGECGDCAFVVTRPAYNGDEEYVLIEPLEEMKIAVETIRGVQSRAASSHSGEAVLTQLAADEVLDQVGNLLRVANLDYLRDELGLDSGRQQAI